MYALIQYHPLWRQQYYRQVVKNTKIIEHDIGMTKLPISDIELEQEKQHVRYIEQEFSIQLRGLVKDIKNDLGDGNLFIYVGRSGKQQENYITYNIKKQKFEEVDSKSNVIVTYSEEQHVTSSEYLRCIIAIIDKSLKMKKRPIIYCDIEITDEQMRYRSLHNKIICGLLEKVNGLLICRVSRVSKEYYRLTSKPFEPYINHVVYTQDDVEEVLYKLKKCNLCNTSTHVFKKTYYALGTRENNEDLYSDVFYKQIEDETMIYVPILPNSVVPKEAYEQLGLQYITIERNYGILYGKKKTFDAHTKELIRNVLPQFTPQIMTYTYPIIEDVYSGFKFDPRKKQRYNGKGVYIGIIGVEGIDYTHPDVTIDPNKSHIAYVWEQVDGAKGKEYTAEDIKSALEVGNKLSIAPQALNSMETLIMGMAGGKGDTPEGEFRGVATESEFIVAKIKKAPDELQNIYGGVPTNQAALLEDILIGVNKLVEFANLRGKPLVICMPFGTSINNHDGSLVLQNRMEIFANQQGITIVVPTGEEGDKQHHMQVILEDDSEYEIELKDPLNKILGLISIAPRLQVEITLKNLTTNKSYPLSESGSYKEEEISILSRGIRVNFNNGQKQTVFSLEDTKLNKWVLSLQAQEFQATNLNAIDIWISQQEINPSVKLSPSDPFTTITSLGNIEGILCVGNYDNATNTTYKSSGRGYTSQNIIKPTLSAQGKDVPYLNKDNKWELVTGGVAVMANMAAVAAAVYSKALEQNFSRLPNTPVMSTLLIEQLDQIETVSYPNPSQGYGIFDRKALDRILDPSSSLKI